MKARVNGCKGLLMFMNDYEVFLIILYDPEITNQSFSTIQVGIGQGLNTCCRLVGLELKRVKKEG
jgi:hypothetical protein